MSIQAENVLMPDNNIHRHIGPAEADIAAMLAGLGYQTLDELAEATVPGAIRLKRALAIPAARGEAEVLAELRAIAGQNRLYRSLLGMGYYGCILPAVLQRNILENPGWYTQYTPYQAEISQGRLEALFNFQTLVADLTKLPVANASLLDEATAAAEAMAMCHALAGPEKNIFLAAADCHPQTLAVVATRARSLGIKLVVGPAERFDIAAPLCGILVQYPTTDGRIIDYSALINKTHATGAWVAVAADLLALTLLKAPGELGDKGADIAVGSTQRLGTPMGYGGPHAAFLATRQEFVRKMPGRLVGLSKDAHGQPAYRLAVQTREQHIRRDKATSNICTAQALPAIIAGMYAVYHGPEGLKRIAQRIHTWTVILAEGLKRLGCTVGEQPVFDTLRVKCAQPQAVLAAAEKKRINLRSYADGTIGVALDELTDQREMEVLLEVFAPPEMPPEGGLGNLAFGSLVPADLPSPQPSPGGRGGWKAGPCGPALNEGVAEVDTGYPANLARTSAFLTQPVFHQYRCEHEILRYIKRLEARDLSLTTSMIPLGSCTMKLNPAAAMQPITWPGFAEPHPLAPLEQMPGYARLLGDLEKWLAEITGLAATSLQPNAGSQGEYAGLLTIRAYHAARGQGQRDVCLIPVSAHGTNPASAVVAGLRVVAVACDAQGNVDGTDLQAKAREHRDRLAALMVTYPSTHGVFEEGIKPICASVHEHGGQVYMDGANLNAQVGLCRPGDIGADVCHINLHKTFCIPHGGGGPGMGPICVAGHLVEFLPRGTDGHDAGHDGKCEIVVSAAPYGSASILPISWAYIALMGAAGLKKATQVAILNANYMAQKLAAYYPVLYTGRHGRVAHEFILDCRELDHSAGVKVEDIAKRLMDYGFHAPTMSWPVPGTLMIEPTESESRAELDRLCAALIAIRQEARAIAEGRSDRQDNPLKNAPHTAAAVTADNWTHPYSRQQAGYPAPWLAAHKFWPAVGRIDNAYGDRNLVCTCPPVTTTAARD